MARGWRQQSWPGRDLQRAAAPNPSDPSAAASCDASGPRRNLSKVFALSLAGVKPRALPAPRDGENRSVWKPAATETIQVDLETLWLWYAWCGSFYPG